jgi:hypothetical protein
MPKIFISYRRMDSQERAHRIADWLVLKYGKRNVFIDVDRILGGSQFADVIEESVDKSDVVLIVIRDQWVNLDRYAEIFFDGAGKSCLADGFF